MHDCIRISSRISEPRFLRYAAGTWCVWLLAGCGYVDEHAPAPPVANSDETRIVDKQTSAPVAEPGETRAVKIQATVPEAELGKKRFEIYCAACHQRGGTGIKDQVPPLTGSPWVAGLENRLVRIVLHGLRGPIEIQGKTYNLEMPSFHLLKDAEIAALLSYVRGQYGGPSPPITEATVSRIRAETSGRTTYWTVDELLLEVP